MLKDFNWMMRIKKSVWSLIDAYKIKTVSVKNGVRIGNNTKSYKKVN